LSLSRQKNRLNTHPAHRVLVRGDIVKDIGLYCGACKDLPTRKYMIYVVNSARYTLSRHILADYQSAYPVLLIADECHHYGSPENSRIFDFLSLISPQDQATAYYALGLSATPESASWPG